MLKLTFAVTVAALALTGCSREDDARAKAKLDNAGQELKHDAKVAGQKIEEAAHKATTELRKDGKEASHELKKASDKLADKARQQ